MKNANEYVSLFMFLYGVLCASRGQFGLGIFWLLLGSGIWAFHVRFVAGQLRADALNLPARMAALRRLLA